MEHPRNCKCCKAPEKVEVGDRVRGFLLNQFGTVYDIFEDRGEQWAQVEWVVRGNQYTGNRTVCNAQLVRGLQIAMKAKDMTPNVLG
ncbi:MAG: hypothetical protein Q8M09_14555 [Pseudomonadota bacterium]|nr:hypothetical protein [Pseudomonadota bacterium]